MFPRSPEHQDRPRATPRTKEVLLQEAKEFIDGYYRSMNRWEGKMITITDN